MPELFMNQAAWQQAECEKHYVVGPGPDQSNPAEDEVIVKVAYVAINPSDWKIQDLAYVPLKYPHVFGSDAAGEVVAVGKKVTRFRPGDRVIGHNAGLLHGGARHGSFQLYTALFEHLVAKLPDDIHLSQGVVMPLALSTSIVGLFDNLNLRHPKLHAERSGEVVLIWGGSSSVGSVAIQLARLAGYDVVTTASARNHEYVTKLGADMTFDYNAPDVASQIENYLKGKKFAGVLDCIGDDAALICAGIVKNVAGNGVVPTTLWPPEKGLPDGVTSNLVWAGAPMEGNYKNASIWADFVPEALKAGALKCQPEAQIIKGGLSSIKEGLAVQKRGVSAQKVVVEIDGSMGP